MFNGALAEPDRIHASPRTISASCTRTTMQIQPAGKCNGHRLRAGDTGLATELCTVCSALYTERDKTEPDKTEPYHQSPIQQSPIQQSPVQQNALSWQSLVHCGHSWKRQRPLHAGWCITLCTELLPVCQTTQRREIMKQEVK